MRPKLLPEKHLFCFLRVFFAMCYAQVLSHVRLFATLWPAACQALLSMEFFRQEYWSGLPCPSPRDLPESEMEPMSLASHLLAGVVFTTESPGNPRVILVISFSLIFTFGQFHLSSPCKNKLTP